MEPLKPFDPCEPLALVWPRRRGDVGPDSLEKEPRLGLGLWPYRLLCRCGTGKGTERGELDDKEGSAGIDGRREVAGGVAGAERTELEERESVEDGPAARGEGTVNSVDIMTARPFLESAPGSHVILFSTVIDEQLHKGKAKHNPFTHLKYDASSFKLLLEIAPFFDKLDARTA